MSGPNCTATPGQGRPFPLQLQCCNKLQWRQQGQTGHPVWVPKCLNLYDLKCICKFLINQNWHECPLMVKHMVKCFSELEFKDLKESSLHAIWTDPARSWVYKWLVCYWWVFVGLYLRWYKRFLCPLRLFFSSMIYLCVSCIRRNPFCITVFCLQLVLSICPAALGMFIP